MLKRIMKTYEKELNEKSYYYVIKASIVKMLLTADNERARIELAKGR